MSNTLTTEQLKELYITLAKIAKVNNYNAKVKQDSDYPNMLSLCLGWDYSEKPQWDKFETELQKVEDEYSKYDNITIDLCADVTGNSIRTIYC
jgi:hypothetical protein